MEGDLTWGSEQTIQYIDDVLQNYTCKTYIIFIKQCHLNKCNSRKEFDLNLSDILTPAVTVYYKYLLVGHEMFYELYIYYVMTIFTHYYSFLMNEYVDGF